MRNLFTEEEIILCTYAAMYNENDFGGLDKIFNLQKRSMNSIKMKIMNIASMLDEQNIERFNYSRIHPLTGLPAGKIGRRTNWDIVKKLHQLPQEEFLKRCNCILGR